MKLYSTAIKIACMLIVVGCTEAENTTPATDSTDKTMSQTRSPDASTNNVTWELSGVEPYFKVASPPVFDASRNAFVVVLEATRDGGCALKPLDSSTLLGFEAIFIGDNDQKIHIAHDIGSATQMAAPAEAYIQVAPDRISVEPQRWTAGTQVTLTIASGLDPAVRNGTRRIQIWAI